MPAFLHPSHLLDVVFPYLLVPPAGAGPALAVIAVFLFCVGACLGSFLNVCIYRIPLGVSVVSPRSACAACGAPIPWWNNLPIASWLLLRGRSACCGTRIDARYVWIELFAALLLPALFLHEARPLLLPVLHAVLLYGLLAASMIDIDHFLIPDRFTLGGIVAGVAAALACPALLGKATRWDAFNASLMGAFVGGFLLWLVVKLGSKALKKEAMGLGDVKLLAAIGAFLGWESVLFIIAVSSCLGSLYGAAMLLRQRQVWGSRLPYGPFLSLAAFLWIFGGSRIAGEAMAWWRHSAGLGGQP